MKTLFTIFSISLSAFACYAQNWQREELLRWYNNPADSIYIEDRTKLERVTGHHCTDTTATFSYASKNGSKLEINIQGEVFHPEKHVVDVVEYVYKIVHGEKRVDYGIAKNLIDGRYSYGIDGSVPRRETTAFVVKWNGVQLSIPDTAFSNLFDLHMCFDYVPDGIVQAYLTKDNSHLYIYLSGSDAAGSYGVKFVFDRKRYITRLITTNEMTDHFDFLDGTAKPED